MKEDPPKRKKFRDFVLHRPGSFLIRVLRSFRRNQGLLLAGAVAYYTLLSIIPMFALILVGLSHFIEEEPLLQTIATNLELLVPGYAESLTEQMRAFLFRRHLVGVVGTIVMVFFSSLAFTVLENTMAVIFSHRIRTHRRSFFISAIMPYGFILLMGLGLMLVTFISGALDTISEKHIFLFGFDFSLEGSSRAALYLTGQTGMVLILTSLYLVMPVGRITLRHALAGGVTATILWEIIRHILMWYYANISLVNVIYGSLATAVVALLSIEIAVIILLLGAQVIAEFERSAAGLSESEHTVFKN